MTPYFSVTREFTAPEVVISKTRGHKTVQFLRSVPSTNKTSTIHVNLFQSFVKKQDCPSAQKKGN